MTTTARYLLCALFVLTIVLFACGDDDPTEPAGPTPPAQNLAGTYELLDFREWGFRISGGGGTGEWGEAGTRTDYSYSPANYDTHTGEMAFTDTMLYQVFVADGDSSMTPVQIRSITYTDETDQGVMEIVQAFSMRNVYFDCTGMELRLDYEKLEITALGGTGENTRWEVWRKVSDDSTPLW